MDVEEQLVRQIHAAPSRFVLAITGGGSGAIAALLQAPGASQTVLEALVPYAPEAVVRFLGAAPDQFCSPQAARAMAMAAFVRARELAGADRGGNHDDPSRVELLRGVACTASLTSTVPKRGSHRTHVAVQSAGCTETASLELLKGARSRGEEERLVTRLILNQLAAASGLAERLELNLLTGETIRTARTEAEGPWRALMLGAIRAACVRGASAGKNAARGGECGASVVFPGAFHPLHAGHLKMAETAAAMLGSPVQFEIAILNVDKPPLDYTEMAARLGQFTAGQVVWLTRSATFVEKSELFPHGVFIVGIDTIVRIADPRYYGGDKTACRAAIQQIAARGCRFLVFGRKTAAGFRTLRDVRLPRDLLAICEEVPENRFREDVSSTELRRGAGTRL